MKSRERVMRALNRKETDRIPIDIGGISNLTTLHKDAYLNLGSVSYIDEWGITWRCPQDGLYFDLWVILWLSIARRIEKLPMARSEGHKPYNWNEG